MTNSLSRSGVRKRVARNVQPGLARYRAAMENPLESYFIYTMYIYIYIYIYTHTHSIYI